MIDQAAAAALKIVDLQPKLAGESIPSKYNTLWWILPYALRFDYSSSDAMSIGGQTSAASSSAAMEMSNGSGHSHSSSTPPTIPSGLAVVRSESAPIGEKTTLDASSSHVSQRAVTVSIRGRDACTKGYRKDPVDLALESLRWEHEYSDEEREKARIESYKENRRKRYENALAQRKAQLQLQSTNRVKYIIS